MAARAPSQAVAGWIAVLLAGLLAACGGDSGTTSTPAPQASPTATATPTPTPSPTPTATTTPAAFFQTAEYNRSDGPSFHNAITAWQQGANGSGVVIGIVDGGIDTTNPEFAGRISPASGDVTGAGRALLNADSDHGTDVALVAAAARDNAGVMGIAWNATLLMARADTAGSCATTKGCAFDDIDIAAGLDRAVAGGAKVVNISLGGDPASATMLAAVTRAAAAGVVVVVSAGNDGTANPDVFAANLRAAGNGNVIIAGSVDNTGTISSFSDRAGTEAQYYLAALGDSVCCTYQNGQIKVTVKNGQSFVEVFSGTSFSAPQIAGAVALLRQAFPNLTATQVVDLLLKTARDAGDPGTDAVYGRGILDIAAAFAPQGALSLAGGTTLVALGAGGTTSPAMGDAANTASVPAVALDAYHRAYRIDLAAGLHPSAALARLAPALASRQVSVGGGAEGTALAFMVDAGPRAALLPWTGQLRLSRQDSDTARVLAGRVVSRLAPGTTLGFAYAQGADGLVAQMRGASQPAFLIAGGPLDDTGFLRGGLSAMALRRAWHGWGLTLAGEAGRTPRPLAPGAPAAQGSDPTTRFGLALDRRAGPFDLALGASWLAERGTLLGARFNPALGLTGADTLLLDGHLVWHPAAAVRLGASWRSGFTSARGGLLTGPGARLVASAWALDASYAAMWRAGDELALRLAQPLRVATGGLALRLPVAWDYASGQATMADERLNLAPRGRELTAELAYRTPLLGGSASANLFWRREPAHIAAAPDDGGLALSWHADF
jgi:subtilisin family serine protease